MWRLGHHFWCFPPKIPPHNNIFCTAIMLLEFSYENVEAKDQIIWLTICKRVMGFRVFPEDLSWRVREDLTLVGPKWSGGGSTAIDVKWICPNVRTFFCPKRSHMRLDVYRHHKNFSRFVGIFPSILHFMTSIDVEPQIGTNLLIIFPHMWIILHDFYRRRSTNRNDFVNDIPAYVSNSSWRL